MNLGHFAIIRIKNNFEFEVHILAIDNFLALKLRHNVEQIFSIGFEGITKISLVGNDKCQFLDLYKDQSNPPSLERYLRLLIKPRVSIEVLVKE